MPVLVARDGHVEPGARSRGRDVELRLEIEDNGELEGEGGEELDTDIQVSPGVTRAGRGHATGTSASASGSQSPKLAGHGPAQAHHDPIQGKALAHAVQRHVPVHVMNGKVNPGPEPESASASVLWESAVIRTRSVPVDMNLKPGPRKERNDRATEAKSREQHRYNLNRPRPVLISEPGTPRSAGGKGSSYMVQREGREGRERAGRERGGRGARGEKEGTEGGREGGKAVSYTHLRAHETEADL
eukprot:3272122-Rhodomonas_salina.1